MAPQGRRGVQKTVVAEMPRSERDLQGKLKGGRKNETILDAARRVKRSVSGRDSF